MAVRRQQKAGLARQDSRLSVKSLIESIENATKQAKAGPGSRSSSTSSLNSVASDGRSMTTSVTGGVGLGSAAMSPTSPVRPQDWAESVMKCPLREQQPSAITKTASRSNSKNIINGKWRIFIISGVSRAIRWIVECFWWFFLASDERLTFPHRFAAFGCCILCRFVYCMCVFVRCVREKRYRQAGADREVRRYDTGIDFAVGERNRFQSTQQLLGSEYVFIYFFIFILPALVPQRSKRTNASVLRKIAACLVVISLFYYYYLFYAYLIYITTFECKYSLIY